MSAFSKIDIREKVAGFALSDLAAQEAWFTPEWVTRAFLQKHFKGPFSPWQDRVKGLEIWEPAAGRGYIAHVVKQELGCQVYATDKYLYCSPLVDVQLRCFLTHQELGGIDWVVSNPPFKLADLFIIGCLNLGVSFAFLLPLTYLASQGRYKSIFKEKPPTHVYSLVKRPPFNLGKVAQKGKDNSDYGWFVWDGLHRQANSASRWPSQLAWLDANPSDHGKGGDEFCQPGGGLCHE